MWLGRALRRGRRRIRRLSSSRSTTRPRRAWDGRTRAPAEWRVDHAKMIDRLVDSSAPRTIAFDLYFEHAPVGDGTADSVLAAAIARANE